MRNVLFVAFLVFIIAGCASQGGKSADIEQRDLFDQQQQAQRQQEAAKQSQVMKEQEELKRQLEEQQKRQAQAQQQEQPIVRPLPDSTVGESQLKSDPWSQLKETGSLLSKRSIYYEYDRYDIKEEYVPIIDAHAKFLMSPSDLKIFVQGN